MNIKFVCLEDNVFSFYCKESKDFIKIGNSRVFYGIDDFLQQLEFSSLYGDGMRKTAKELKFIIDTCILCDKLSVLEFLQRKKTEVIFRASSAENRKDYRTQKIWIDIFSYRLKPIIDDVNLNGVTYETIDSIIDFDK